MFMRALIHEGIHEEQSKHKLRPVDVEVLAAALPRWSPCPMVTVSQTYLNTTTDRADANHSSSEWS
jgi:hypothetical protein